MKDYAADDFDAIRARLKEIEAERTPPPPEEVRQGPEPVGDYC